MGRRCVRCGINHPLTWDHINNDVKRTITGVRRALYLAEQPEMTRIIQTGRSERLQLLCHNCNHLKQFDPEEFAKNPTYGPKN